MARAKSRVVTPEYQVGGRFDTVVMHVLKIEGGHSNDRTDRGGETNYGISLRFLKIEGLIDANRDGFADFDLDFDGDIDGADIRALTPQDAKNLYFRCFWNRVGLDRLPFFIDAAVFDQAVNGGCVAAVKMLQRAANDLQMTDPLVVDGIFGRQTIATISKIQRLTLLPPLVARYRSHAETRYRAIVAADPSQRKYLDGWIKRARRLGDV